VEVGTMHFLRDNLEDWKLNLVDWRWERLTSRNWTQFGIRRKDRKLIPLWDIRHASWSLESNMEDFYKEAMKRLEEFIGFRPNVTLVKDLYNFADEPNDLHKDEKHYNAFWIYLDGVRIRFTEEMHTLQVVIEGSLTPDKVSLIQEQLINRLSALVNSPCELEEY